ncbi:tape measure protein [Mycolicibacterium sphagni]|uniref:tape measure protein n=1 Tax=Mycolicibacterium sphagni TaxID=1786 RepID=UPI001A9C45B5|nr:tape measure protein [Mycolicibacterium sphagni]
MSGAAKLASGYIDLTVKYASAMKQVSADFDSLQGTASRAGQVAGQKLSSSLATEVSKGTKASTGELGSSLARTLAKELGGAGDKASKQLLKSLAAGNDQARRDALVAGRNYASALQTSMRGGGTDVAKRWEAEFRNALNARDASRAFYDEFHSVGVVRSRQVFAPLEQAGVQTARRTGSLMAGAISTTLTGALGIGGGGLVGYTLFSGLDRLKTLQTATTQLQVMHKSAEQIKQITDDVTSVISGTPVKLDEAMNSVTQALSGGVKEGAQLKQYIGDIADAAGSAGKPFGQISLIFGQVLGKGKLMAEEIQQFEENGVHVRAALMNTFGWTGAQLEKQVSKGKVTLTELQKAVEHDWGGLSARMGDTFQGAIDRMHASVARVGANFIGAVFGSGGPNSDPLAGATGGVNKLTDKLKELENWTNSHGGEIHNFFKGVGDIVGETADKLGDIKAFFDWMDTHVKTPAEAGKDTRDWVDKYLLGIPEANAAPSAAPFNPGPKAPSAANPPAGGWFAQPSTALPSPATAGSPAAASQGLPSVPYGLPSGTNTGGSGTGATFPEWVMQMADRFGIKPSTYGGHQESDRNEPGYAPNPNHENRGIDWTGPVENLQKFADYLATIPQDLEQVIWENPNTHQKTGIGGGQINPGYYDQATYDEHGGNDPKNVHVHTRQSRSIPLPGMPQPALSAPAPGSTPFDPTGGLLSGTTSGGNIPTPSTASLGPDASRDQVVAALVAEGRRRGLSDQEIAGVLAVAQAESNFGRVGFMGFSTQTADTGYTGGAPYANDFNKSLQKFYDNYQAGGYATQGGPKAKSDALAALQNGDSGPYLQWLQYGVQGAVPQGKWNQEYAGNLSQFFNQWRAQGYSGGGGVWGSGSSKVDSIPAMLAPGEHVLDAEDVKKMGGQSGVYAFRSALNAGVIPGFDDGGAVDPKLRDAQNHLADLQNQVQVSQAQLNEVLNNPDADPVALLQAQQGFGSLNREFQQAQADLPIIARGGSPSSHPENKVFSADDAAKLSRARLDALKGKDDVPASQMLSAQYDLEQALRTQTEAHGDYAKLQQDQQPDFLGELGKSFRTEGYIPAAAGNGSVAGTSFLSGIYGMGAEVINGIIDQAASAASSAASMGVNMVAPGAGGAAGAAAQFGIGMGANIAKRGVKYGAQMLGIGTDALIEQLTPFGAPRWLSTDPMGFMPQQQIMQAATTTIEKAFKQQDPKNQLPEVPAAPEQPAPSLAPMSGAASTPTQPALSGSAGTPVAPPAGPVQPMQAPTPSINAAPGQSFLDRYKQYLGGYAKGGAVGIFDDGGWLQPGGIAVNKSKTVEPMPVFNGDQWNNLNRIANQPAPQLDPKAMGGGDDFRIILENVTVGNADELRRKMDDYQQLRTMRYRGRPSMGGK